MIKILKINPYERKELKELFFELSDTIFDESGRGAILIATAHIDEYLTKLIEANLPVGISKANKERLFKYPGVISSFSSKIELSYAFRLIEKEVYDSLNTLRKIRNDAAHSSKKFNLFELNERMKTVYSFDKKVYAFIKQMSRDMIVQSKITDLKKLYKESLTEDEAEKQAKVYIEKPENQKIIEEQLPHWELLNGLCFICGVLIYKAEIINDLLKDIETWDDLID